MYNRIEIYHSVKFQQSMSKRQDFPIDFKLSPLYSAKITELAVDSKVSFDNFSTPGWSSVMNTETSAEPPLPHTQITHNKIMEKLNKLKDIDLRESNFSKIRVPESSKNSNLLIYQQEAKKKNLTESPSVSHQQISGEKASTQAPGTSKNHHKRSETNIAYPLITIQNRTQSVKKDKENHCQSTQVLKRFNHITVHEHLYLNSKKQATKRAIQKILDDEYKKQNVIPFKPIINPKSQELAEKRFSRIKEKEEMETQLSEQYKKSETSSMKRLQGKDKNMVNQQRESNKYKILMKLFYLLSQGTQQISKVTIKQILEQLPIMCLRMLQKLLQKIYAGKKLSWLQFLSEVNDKKVVPNKQGFFVIFEKWWSRRQKPISQSNTKVGNQ